MNKILKLLTVISVSIILFAFIHVSAFTYETERTGNCGENLTWTFSDGTLMINGHGKMNDYKTVYLNGSWHTNTPWDEFMSSINEVIISEGVTHIGDYAFWHNNSLKSVTIPASIISIGGYAFNECLGLEGVYIVNLSAWCRIDFENSFSTPLRYTDNLYLSERILTDVIIPNDITEIKDYTFAYSGIKNVVMHNDVISVGDSAFRSTKLETISLSSSLNYISDGAFADCNTLKGVYITNIASWCNIKFDGYYNTSNPLRYAKKLYLNNVLLTDLVIPEGVPKISSDSFYCCDTIKTIEIPNSVTSIEEKAFYNCSNLSNITIPKTVTNIDNSAFEGCINITTVHYKGSNEQWSKISVGSNNTYLTNATIHYNYNIENIVEVNVTVRDENGNICYEENIAKNTMLNYTELPTKEGCSFELYSDSRFNNKWSETDLITDDIILYIKYTRNKYKHTFLDWDGTILKESTTYYDSTIIPPANPYRPSSQKNIYIFAGWDGYVESLKQPAADVIFVAQYITKERTVSIFENLEHTETTVEYGDEYTEIETVAYDIEEGTVLIVSLYSDVQLVYTDINPNYTTSTSISIKTDKLFDTVKVMNWSSFTELKPIYGIYDTNSVCVIDFNLNYEDAVEVPERQIVEKGTKILKPANPSRKNYTFVGWFIDSACTNPYNFDDALIDNTVLYAKWESTADKAYNTLGNYFVNYGITTDNTEYYLKYTSSGTTYFVVYNKNQQRFFFVSQNPNDHNYSCSVSCDKNSSTQEIFMSYANNGRNTPWGLIETEKFSSSNRELLSYQYEGFDANNSSYYKSVLISKAITTLNGAEKIITNTGLGITLADLGFLNY